MIKNFFKNHPIHKKIVPFLDVFFLCKPLNFFSYWSIICIGMYLPLFLSNNSPLFITDFNYQFFCLFISLSLILCCYNVKKQLLDLNSSKRNVINLVKNKYSEDFIYNMVKYLLFFSIIFIFFVSWENLIVGVLLIILNLSDLENKISKKHFYPFIYEFTIVLLFFISGLIYISFRNNFIYNVQVIIYLIPYLCFYLSIYLISDIMNNSTDKNSSILKDKGIFISNILMSIGLLLAVKLNDPLSSICIVVSFPFFLYALLRNLKKDIQRAFIYPIFIVNFFIITVFPYLAIPSLVLFYLSKYYNWHRFNYHYPTFLVEND